MNLFAELVDPDSFLITPALVVTLGRCEDDDSIAAVRLSLSWLFWTIGLDLTLPHRH